MGWLGLFSCTVHFGVTICPVDIHFWVISELYGNKPGQKMKNTILPHIFPQKCKKLKEIYNLLKKGVSGLPYLKISTWKFCETCAKLKHLGPLVMWNCQISQDRESPQKWTVQCCQIYSCTVHTYHLLSCAPTFYLLSVSYEVWYDPTHSKKDAMNYS